MSEQNHFTVENIWEGAEWCKKDSKRFAVPGEENARGPIPSKLVVRNESHYLLSLSKEAAAMENRVFVIS